MAPLKDEYAGMRSLYLPAYTYADAGRYAQTSPSNVRRWIKGLTSGRRRTARVFPESPSDGLSYVQLVEVRFVARMRKLGFTLEELRQARAYVKKFLPAPYPFATTQFKFAGTNLFIQHLSGFESDGEDLLVAAGQGGQISMRECLEGVIKELDYDADLAVRWYPLGKDRPIVIDPRISFGRPTIAGKGIPTSSVASRIHAGDSLLDTAEDFGLTVAEAEEALAFESTLKAA